MQIVHCQKLVPVAGLEVERLFHDLGDAASADPCNPESWEEVGESVRGATSYRQSFTPPLVGNYAVNQPFENGWNSNIFDAQRIEGNVVLSSPVHRAGGWRSGGALGG